MDDTGMIPAAALIIDDSASAAYAREIRDMLGTDMFAAIVDATGRTLWTDDEVRAAQHSHALARLPLPDGQPCMHTLAPGWVAYLLPLSLSSRRRLTLRITIHDETPPSLRDLERMTADTLACLARQIEIDSSLTNSRIAAGLAPDYAPALDELLAVPSAESNIPETLAVVCRHWRQTQDIVGLAISLTDQCPLTYDCRIPEVADRLPQIATRMQAKANGSLQAVRTRLRVADGQVLTVIVRNFFDAERNQIGSVLLIDDASAAALPKLSRQLANVLGQWLSTGTSPARLLSRSDLLNVITRAQRGTSPTISSLVYIDVDRMHAINDAFGYSAGDRALKTLGHILTQCAGADALVAHLSGDRFAIFLPGTHSEQAAAVARRVLRQYAEESIGDGRKSIGFSASAGIATIGNGVNDPEDVLIVAEVAARAAKERGGNQYALHQEIDDSVIQRRSDVDKVGFLQMALIENKFVLFAQRIASLESDRAEKFELLTRLEDHDSTIAHPGEMLSAAERYHMMTALDRWVVNTALTTLAGAENSLEVSLSTFCINVSAQSIQDDSFVDHIEARIAETGVSAESLCFEITETSLVRNIETAQHFINRLQRMGCQVALDDFGTGYSSFAYLKNLPVNYLKIDGSFVRDMLESPLSRAIIESIVKIAKVTGASTVAEHVESDAIRNELQYLGVDYVQGFAVHRPEPLSNVLSAIDEATPRIADHVELIELDEYMRPARMSG